MPTLFDVVIFCFLLFFLLDGWRKGLLRSGVGLVTLGFCSMLGIIYYDLTGNAVKAVLFTTIATTIVTAFILMLLAIGRHSVDPNYRDYSPMISRVLGSMVNLIWQGFILLIIVFLISLAPLQVFGFDKVQRVIRQSFSYTFIKNSLSNLPALQRIVTAFSVFQDPAQMQALSSTPEFQSFFSNKKVQEMLKDESFMQDIENKDFSKILANPQILKLLDDNQAMESFTELAKKVYLLDVPKTPKEPSSVKGRSEVE